MQLKAAMALLSRKRGRGRPSRDASAKLAKARKVVKAAKAKKAKKAHSKGRARAAAQKAPAKRPRIKALVLKKYPSKSKPGLSHEVRRGADGKVYCTCPAWRFKRPGRARGCKHLSDYLGKAARRNPKKKKKKKKQKKQKRQARQLTPSEEKSRNISNLEEAYFQGSISGLDYERAMRELKGHRKSH